MGFSIRGIQAAQTVSGFGFHAQNTLFDTFPVVLQNLLTSNTANVASSTTLVDAVASGTTGLGIQGNGLQVELGEGVFSNWWDIEVHGICSANASGGLKIGLQAYDGLTIIFGAAAISYNAAAGSVSATGGAPGAVGGSTAAVVSFDLQATIQIAGYGRLGLQFSQNASFATPTFLTSGKIKATTILS